MNFYNENDPKAAAWLRELIAAGHIAPGDVDERSITEIQPHELTRYTQCHFFAGIGGWSLALRLAGWPDTEPVWTGSCPCQPFSAAGKQRGTDDERHLWPQFRSLIAHAGPTIVFGEQVASALGRAWLAGVRADLEALGYGVGAADLCAAGVGAPHMRQRLYWMAQSSRGECAAGSLHNSRPEAGNSQFGHGSGSCGVADAANGGCSEHEPESRRRTKGPLDAAERGGAFDGLADADDTRPQGRGCAELPECADERAAGQSGDAGGLAVPNGRNASAEGLQRSGEQRQQPQDGRVGAWAAFDLLPCRDGKARRVEPGTFPLVAGLPRGVVRGGDISLPIEHRPRPSFEEAKATAEGRVMRLRGYGNSIVPQLAAEFISACREVIG